MRAMPYWQRLLLQAWTAPVQYLSGIPALSKVCCVHVLAA